MHASLRHALAGLALLTACISTQNAAAADEPAPTKKPALKPLVFTGRGTLKGTAVFVGVRPNIAALDRDILAAMAGHVDKPCCLGGTKEEKEQQIWRINPKGGVANVVVFLRPPEGFYFKMEADDLNPKRAGWSKEVVMDQPHCAFLPHVAIAFPGYYDPESSEHLARTEQVFTVKNSANILHNTNWVGRDNPGRNSALPPTREETLKLVPDRMAITVQCNIHPWMKAYIWAFDHPYAAVTDTDGNFEIKNVPAGVKLQVLAWHEETGWLLTGGRKGEAIEIQAGKVKELPIKVK